MHLGILGANSYIARDLICFLARDEEIEADLFVRRPDEQKNWAAAAGVASRFRIAEYRTLGSVRYDALLNFVGVGDPAKIAGTSTTIFEITFQFDQMCLDYLRSHPTCRYVFFSSGAVYGGSFDRPADVDTIARLNINTLSGPDYYAVAKLHAECRHRALTFLPITDLRIFSYFSRTIDLSKRFFLADIIRAIQEQRPLRVSDEPTVRDFLHPCDLHGLITAVLRSPEKNSALDCYSRAPLEKQELLDNMQEQFGLTYELLVGEGHLTPSRSKPYYYSLRRDAAQFGYIPLYSSWRCILEEVRHIL